MKNKKQNQLVDMFIQTAILELESKGEEPTREKILDIMIRELSKPVER